jgi:TetR/AcrR family transcriptional repressor for divergent bdcA
MPKEKTKPRGRPRKFDPEQAVSVAQCLFHERGYDEVSVADVTDALGIKAPSFYAAFGSKSELYERVIVRYAADGAVPLHELLSADRPVAECLAAVLEEAARRYGNNPRARGCIVLEGCGSNDRVARMSARVAHAAAESVIFDYIAVRHPKLARELTEYISTVMIGLSAKARRGQSLEQLLSTAHMASRVLESSLSAC